METLPNNACLFTYDAISIYTNIDTTQCINQLTTFFLNNPTTTTQYPHLKPKALTEALHLVKHNNRMKFGNLVVHQHKGIAWEWCRHLQLPTCADALMREVPALL